MTATTELEIQPLTSVVGAAISGIDLRRPLPADTVRAIRQGLLDYGVVFFRDQPLTPEQMHAFVAKFGTPIPEPTASRRRHVLGQHVCGLRRAIGAAAKDARRSQRRSLHPADVRAPRSGRKRGCCRAAPLVVGGPNPAPGAASERGGG